MTPLNRGTYLSWCFGKCKTYWKLQGNKRASTETCRERLLEIGPSENRLEGFETLNILPGKEVDYLLDATKPLPFDAGVFDLIYASHIIEHVPWYQVEDVLTEWVRILKPSGKLEIWTPNGLKICRAFVDKEDRGEDRYLQDEWPRFNEERDVCKWASGRIFAYGDGTGRTDHPNWHRSLFSPRYLHSLFEKVGLKNIREMKSEEVRGYDHGWINLGIEGTKP